MEDELKNAIAELATKEDLKGLADKKDVKKIRDEIKAIHLDLVKHDERAEKWAQEAAAFRELETRVEKMRTNILEKLHVEV